MPSFAWVLVFSRGLSSKAARAAMRSGRARGSRPIQATTSRSESGGGTVLPALRVSKAVAGETRKQPQQRIAVEDLLSLSPSSSGGVGRAVVDLRLNDNNLDAASLAGLARGIASIGQACHHLTSLSLAGNVLSPRSWRLLLQGLRQNRSQGGALRRLNLSKCGCFYGPSGPQALRDLFELTMDSDKTEPPAERDEKNSSPLGASGGGARTSAVLRELVLRGNGLASPEYFREIRSVLTDSRCKLLALDLSYNALGDDGLAAVGSFGRARRRIRDGEPPRRPLVAAGGLLSLRLRGCRLTSDGVKRELCTALCLPGADALCELDLSENSIGDAAACELGNALLKRWRLMGSKVRRLLPCWTRVCAVGAPASINSLTTVTEKFASSLVLPEGSFKAGAVEVEASQLRTQG